MACRVCVDNLAEPALQEEEVIVRSPGGPEFYEKGILSLASGVESASVVFRTEKVSSEYTFNELGIKNSLDSLPFTIHANLVSHSTKGFTVVLNGITDTANYKLRWEVNVVGVSRAVVIPPPPAPVPEPEPPPVNVLEYPIGVYGLYSGQDINPVLADQPGLVGININQEWDEIETAQGVYDWSGLDDKIAQAKAAGFNAIIINITASSFDTPQWMLDLLPSDQKLEFIDDAQQHGTYCRFVSAPLYWNPTFHAARKALIVEAGRKYASDTKIVASFASAFNQNSNDWHIQDTVDPDFTCPDCGEEDPGQECGPQPLDQPQQWLDAGWTRELMLTVGQEMADTAAAAFPTGNIKLPIGGLDDRLAQDNPLNDGYSRLARDMELYVYGDGTPEHPAQSYANRFYMSRNVVTAGWAPGSTYDPPYPPGIQPDFGAENYLKFMIRKHGRDYNKVAGLQMVSGATNGGNDCAINGGGAGVCPGCVPGANPPEVALCMMTAALNVAISYDVTFVEVFAIDAGNIAFRQLFIDSTIAMGGTPRF